MSLEQRIRRQQMERRVEGYLELGMPQHALEELETWGDPQTLDGQAIYLRGEALRSLERYAEAVGWLRKAAERMPDDIHILLALGWCHKRTGRLDLAIEALSRALKIDAGEAIIHYNLACYWSLAGNKRHVLKHLSRALEMDAKYRDLVHDEPDFNAMRDDPDFQALTSVVV